MNESARYAANGVSTKWALLGDWPYLVQVPYVVSKTETINEQIMSALVTSSKFVQRKLLKSFSIIFKSFCI